MRLHVYMDEELVAEIDRRAGERGRSTYIEDAVRDRIERERRWELIWSAAGTISEAGHPWDPDPASYFASARVRETERHSKAGGKT
jgi:hypothetical protein